MGQTVDFWRPLRAFTKARIGLGNSGDALPTSEVLAFREAHALARDAIHTPLDLDSLCVGLSGLGLGEPLIVTSQATTREEYVRRPDLGRLPGEGVESLPRSGAELGIVIVDGLSSKAVADHAVGLVQAIHNAAGNRWSIAPLVVAKQSRVALGDHIGAALGVETVLVIIGERPGLSVADSLGIYLTHNPKPGLLDSARNCISNIHPPDGLDYASAARTAVNLVAGAKELGASGVQLKDTGSALEAGDR